MLSLRRGSAALARQSRIQPSSLRPRQTRRHASDHTHHEAPQVEESMGTFFYLLFGAAPASAALYYATQPGPNGEPSSITAAIERLSNMESTWERRNTRHTELIEEAAQDKNLFFYTERNRHIELKYPEWFQQGSPYFVPAGHYVNLDKVVEHYRQQHLDEEDRKAKKLAAKAAKASE